MTTLLNTIRAAAVNLGDHALRADLFWEISNGCENAADTFGEAADENSTDYSDIAIATIGGALCEASFAPRHGSSPGAVRDWFCAHGVSF